MEWFVALFVKAAVAAVVVIGATSLAERSGPFWAGLVASLPISAGPAYVVIALEHPSDFIAASALASLTAHPAMVAFVLTMIFLAPRTIGPWALLGALAAWMATVVAIRTVAWTTWSGVSLTAVVFAAGVLAARLLGPYAVAGRAPSRRWFDLPMRALLVSAVVVAVALSGEWLGPGWTGVAAVFPVVFTSMLVILLNRVGGAATAALMAGSLMPLVGFSVAMLVVHLSAGRWGSAIGLSLGLATSLLASLALILARRWRRPAPA
ncbi:MAG: hypothetical protein EXQ85_07710 [Alphaproteobacteria bacterium]|nr:hypothetical protein [Alphaproteobacteria bacterium]